MSLWVRNGSEDRVLGYLSVEPFEEEFFEVFALGVFCADGVGELGYGGFGRRGSRVAGGEVEWR